jgi:isochorismate hydrolase
LKERYFTPESIEETAAGILEGSLELSGRRPLPFDMESAALLVLDMQRYFLDPGSHAFVPSGSVVLPVIENLARAFRSRARPVYMSRHVNTPDDSGMMARWWGDLIDPGSVEAGIVEELIGFADWVFDKTRYDAFVGTGLEERLAGAGARQVVITGVMTHLCVESTARSAFMRGFSAFVPVDGTATCNEAFHRASILNLSHGFASMILSRAIIEREEARDRG